mgnify:FL=1
MHRLAPSSVVPLLLALVSGWGLSWSGGATSAAAQPETAPESPATGAAPGRVCIFPRAAWVPCPKGDGATYSDGILGEPRSRADCLAKASEEPSPRFRVGAGPWTELSAKSWRCVPLPVGVTTRVAINQHSDKVVIEKGCKSQRVDVYVDSQYGSLRSKCSTRKASEDEFLARYSYLGPKAPAAQASAAGR